MMPILETQGLTKRFPGVLALEDVSISVKPGTVHALMGENGAGKSTLGKILAGLYRADSGVIKLEGREVKFGGPQDAQHAGIGMVHQELLFAENLSVADNLSLGDLPASGFWIDESKILDRAIDWLRRIGADVDPRSKVGDLPVSKQQLVQIAGGIGRGAKVLIFDEPTSSLSQAESDRLLALIRELRDGGLTCIYVSHRLDEIFAICDDVTVLRDGRVVGRREISDHDQGDLVNMMIGRDMIAEAWSAPETGNILLEVQNFSSPGKFRDVSLTLRAGEILGLGGLVGAGRTEVTEAIFGLDHHATGSVRVKGQGLKIGDPIRAMAAGLGLVPEDRKRHGLVLSMSAQDNVSLPSMDRIATLTWIRRQQEINLARQYIERMRVKAPSLESLAAGLSGGNQQKLVLAKWLAAHCDVLIVDEPTRGVDVGAKAEIHGLLREIASEGKAVLMVSSDLPELLTVATRIQIMREGLLVGELTAPFSEESAMRAMAGVGGLLNG